MNRWNLIVRWSNIVLFVVLISVIYYSQGRVVSAAMPDPTFGSILVDSPEVYTRERLVNDRFRQDEWLRKRLDHTDSIDFGIQGAQSKRSTKGTSVGTQLTTNPAGNSEAGAGDLPASATTSPALPGTRVSPIDHFRDVLAYREEVRNEIIQNQLDDRHDLDGNTLYRCKFDVTLVPGPQTRASAIVQVSVKGSFGTLDYEPSASTIPGGAYLDLAQAQHEDNATIRIAFDETIGTIAKIHGPQGLDDRTLKSLGRAFEQWQAHLVQDLQKKSEDFDGTLTEKDHKDGSLRDEIQSSVEQGLYWASDYDQPEEITAKIGEHLGQEGAGGIDDYLRLLEEAQTNPSLRNMLLISDANRLPDGDLLVKFLLSKRELQPTVEKASPYLTITLPSAQYPQCTATEVEFQVMSSGLSQGWKETNGQWGQVEESDEDFAVRVATHDETVAASFDSLVREIEGALSEVGESPFVRLDREARTIALRLGFLAFVERLRANKASVYTYAVTPRESAQRISSLSEGRDSLQTMIGLSALAGSTGLATSINQLNQRDAQIGAIERQPLVVGFVGGHAADEGVFGWVLGPRFEVAEQSKGGVGFRHVPAQHSLAAILSAPAWWPEMEVSIRTYWLDEDGNRLDSRGKVIESVQDGTPNESIPPDNVWTVSLPAGAQDLSDLLIGGADTRAKKPSFDFEDGAKVHLTAGTKASIVIPGTHLWRSTVVTLGGETASAITVLPNMNGIIATFDKVPTPPDWKIDGSKPLTEQPYKDLELTVWTSEGKDSVKGVVLLYRQPEDKAEEQSGGPAKSNAD